MERVRQFLQDACFVNGDFTLRWDMSVLPETLQLVVDCFRFAESRAYR